MLSHPCFFYRPLQKVIKTILHFDHPLSVRNKNSIVYEIQIQAVLCASVTSPSGTLSK
jgi:hypothetical protein